MSIRPNPSEARGAFSADLLSLEAERDPELRAEGFYHLARRSEARGETAFAAELYQSLEETPAAARAASRLRVLSGEGTVGERAEVLLDRFAQEATNPSMIFAMGSAGALFKATRFFALSRLAASPASCLTRGWGARALASLAGFAVEAPAFPLAGRFARTALGESQDWSRQALSQELASSVLVLGGLKIGGLASSSLARSLAGSAGFASFTQGMIHQTGMLGGILLGHRLEEMAGLRAPSSASATLVDSLATLLQFNVAGRMTQAAFGAGFRRWESGVELQTQRLSSAFPQFSFPVLPAEAFIPNTAAAMSSIGSGKGDRGAILGSPPMMTKGFGRETRGFELPPTIRHSFLHLNNPKIALARGHLIHLESVLLEGGKNLSSQLYVEIYDRLRRDAETVQNPEFSLEIGDVLSEVLSGIPLDKPGPSLLFNRMIHVHGFSQRTTGESLLAWLANPSLQGHHRRRILHLVEHIFRNDAAHHEEALFLLANYWHRLSGEGKPFRDALSAGLRFFNSRGTWFHRVGGTELGRVALLDPKLSRKHRENILLLMLGGTRDVDLTSGMRVNAMEALENIAKRSDLPQDLKEWLQYQMPTWRAEFLHHNVVRTNRDRGEWNHFSEMAYLLAQEYTPVAERKNFSRALRRSMFDASFNSPGYNMMVRDALNYLQKPHLGVESRQTFLIQVLKAYGDIKERLGEGEISFPGRHRGETFDMLRDMLDTLHDLPREERLALADHLIGELERKDEQRAHRASLVLAASAELLNPGPELLERLSAITDRTSNPETRDLARQILQYWQTLN